MDSKGLRNLLVTCTVLVLHVGSCEGKSLGRSSLLLGSPSSLILFGVGCILMFFCVLLCCYLDRLSRICKAKHSSSITPSDNICDTPDQRDMEAPPPCDEAPPSYWESLPPDWESLPPDRESLPPDWESLPPDRESLPPYVINKPIKLHQVPPAVRVGIGTKQLLTTPQFKGWDFDDTAVQRIGF